VKSKKKLDQQKVKGSTQIKYKGLDLGAAVGAALSIIPQ